ncbi:hypothetical protein P8452_04343 [Trifolium repens]|nr:hypothetical protein P8452_04343 [Trifolium repens]
MTDSGDSQGGRSKLSSEMLKMADNDNTKGRRKSAALSALELFDRFQTASIVCFGSLFAATEVSFGTSAWLISAQSVLLYDCAFQFMLDPLNDDALRAKVLITEYEQLVMDAARPELLAVAPHHIIVSPYHSHSVSTAFICWCSSQLEDEVALCEAQMESWSTNLQVMAAKERQYMQQSANYKIKSQCYLSTQEI